jgi:heptosyltransferase-2
VWIVGAKKDMTIADSIAKDCDNRLTNLVGLTTLDEAIDVLALADSVVSNDSGLMHIAAALQKPLVALYGSTTDDFTPPLSNKAKVLKLNLSCQPCFQRECPLNTHQCMRDLKPELVIHALSEMN